MRIVHTLALVACLAPALCAPSGAAEALVTGNGGTLALGSNWGPYETYGGTSFRWVDNDAEFVLRGGSGVAHVWIGCEGGPSLAQRTFPLRVLDGSRRQVDHIVCDGKDRRAEMLLPLGGAGAQYVLHVDGGGKRVAGERRILNFRVFSLDDGRGVASGADVVDARTGVRLGAGWYPVESFKGQTFRWMDGDGRIFVSADRAVRGSLRMLLEVGPSLGSRQAAVDVRDARGRTLLHTTLFGRGVVLVPVQLQPGENELVVHVTSPNKPAPHERRILNLRLFNAVALR